MKINPILLIGIAVLVIVFIVFGPMKSGMYKFTNNVNIITSAHNLQKALFAYANGNRSAFVSVKQHYQTLGGHLGPAGRFRDPFPLMRLSGRGRTDGWPNSLSSQNARFWIEGCNNLIRPYTQNVDEEYVFQVRLMAYASMPTNTIRERSELLRHLKSLRLTINDISSNGRNPDINKISKLLFLDLY
jgi:hypothetical protein